MLQIGLAVMRGQAIERTFNVSAGRVWDALWDTIVDLGYPDVKADIERWTIDYRTLLRTPGAIARPD
jgi:hypothetical protein